MQGIGRVSGFTSGEITRQPLAVNDLVACLKPNFLRSDLSEERRNAFKDNCLFAYKALFPIYQNKQTFPVTITLSDQTQLTITQSTSGLTLSAHGENVASNIPFKFALERLFRFIKTCSHFDAILTHKERYLALGWEGNFYYKYLPSPEQLAPNYKQTPYMSIDEFEPVDLNGKVLFSKKNPLDPGPFLIVCMHLSTKCIDDVSMDKNGQGKFKVAHYSNPTSLTNHVTVATHERYIALRKNASSYDIIDNDSFGHHIQQCFNKMETTQQSRESSKIRTLLVESTMHSMMVRLRIKSDESGNPIYVVKFYDPNITNKTARVETDNLSTLESQTLEQYIGVTNSLSYRRRYFDYFPEDQQICLIMECDNHSEIDSVNKGSFTTERKLASRPKGSIAPHFIHHLFINNFSTDLTELTDELKAIGELSPERLVEIISARLVDGSSLLYMLMELCNEVGLAAYGKLLVILNASIPRKELIELLAAKRADGTPVLYINAQYNHKTVIGTFKELVFRLLSNEECDQLFDKICELNEISTPALYQAKINGSDEVKENVCNVHAAMIQLIADWRKEVADRV